MRFERAVDLPDQVALDDDLIIEGENLDVLPKLPSAAFDVIYIDPPFNTGRAQRHNRIRATPDPSGHPGFGDKGYRRDVISSLSYDDPHRDYLEWIRPRLVEAHRLLAPHGTLYFHIDYREAHYCKVLLDEIFGRDAFLNEIIWAYDFGGRPRNRWPAKHDTILVYVREPGAHHFDAAEVEREPYMAPGLVGAEKAARGKLPTDCYSDDTEVLSRRGWLPFELLTLEDELATVTATGELVFARPSKLHVQRYAGPMVHFEAKHLDLFVTPGHSMLVKPKRAAEFEYRLAKDLAGGSSTYFGLRKQLEWRGEAPPDAVNLPPVEYLRPGKPLPAFDPLDWCEFMGWYLSEGSFVFNRDNCTVHISQVKRPERVERIRALLERMGLCAYYDGRSFAMNNKQLATYLSRFGRAGEKHVPRELLSWPPGHLERLYEGLMLGDGFVSPRGYELYSTVSPRLADDVQELMIKLGTGASVRVEWRRDTRWAPIYRVSRHASRESTIWPSRHRVDREYDGKVYCATMPTTHTLLVRRGGVTAVCGNCWWHTIVPTNGKERTGYPTQKPEGIVRRMVAASSKPGGWCLDFFAGSGTLGAVCHDLDRRWVLVDESPSAIDVMRVRLSQPAEG